MSDSMPGPGAAPEVTHDVTPVAAPPSFDAAAPTPIGVGRTPTGNAEVDARLERLADADHLPAEGHIEVYEDVHHGLQSELTALDARPAPAPTPSYHKSYNNRS